MAVLNLLACLELNKKSADVSLKLNLQPSWASLARSLAAVIRVVTQRSSLSMRDDPNDGREGDCIPGLATRFLVSIA